MPQTRPKGAPQTRPHRSTGDSYSLLLTTRKLVREVLGTMADGHSLHNRLHLCLALRLRNVEVSFYLFFCKIYHLIVLYVFFL